MEPKSLLMAEIEKLAQEAKAEDVKVTVECSLFEFYNGAVKEVTFERSVVYENNEGTYQEQADI